MKSKKYQKKKLSFQSAVKKTTEIKLCYKVGLQALKQDERNKIELDDPTKCGGSLFIDQCLINQKKYPDANRWDYAIDYKDEVFFIEFHSANTGQVDKVLKKLQWLKDWLITKAPEIDKLKSKTKFPFIWIQSSDFHIPLHSSQYRKVVQMNLKPISKLILI
jgi:hypothetical protein